MPRPVPPEALAAIELLVLDVDGVMTEGVIALDDRGVETKHFSVRDGAAVSLWRKGGGRVAILSGRKSECVSIRAAELGISPVVQGSKGKAEAFRAILEETGIPAEKTLYMGDDWPDLPAMALAGVSACPSDAATEVLAVANLVAKAPGGHGAVRDVIETILKSRGDFERLIAGAPPAG